jgi:hypothetical protein
MRVFRLNGQFSRREERLPDFRQRARLRHSSLFCSILLSLISASTASAQYRFDSWTTDNGLPQNSVMAMLQTRDGYFWLATSDGLVRFDGVRLTVFNRGNTARINSNRFTCLFEDEDGTLWIGTEDGGLVRHRNGAFRTFTTDDGLPHRWVKAIRSDDGGLLIATDAGLTLLKEENFIPYVPKPGEPKNCFSPGVLFRGQPIVFQPGVHDRVFSSTFQISASQTQITWFLDGNTVVATPDSVKLCNPPRFWGNWSPNGRPNCVPYRAHDLVKHDGFLWLLAPTGNGIVEPDVASGWRFWPGSGPGPQGPRGLNWEGYVGLVRVLPDRRRGKPRRLVLDRAKGKQQRTSSRRP